MVLCHFPGCTHTVVNGRAGIAGLRGRLLCAMKKLYSLSRAGTRCQRRRIATRERDMPRATLHAVTHTLDWTDDMSARSVLDDLREMMSEEMAQRDAVRERPLLAVTAWSRSIHTIQIERAGFRASMKLERKKDEARLSCVACNQICYLSAVV